jgi:hypothetical protein
MTASDEFERQFASIRQAEADPKDHTLVVHMWEFQQDKRKDEIKSALAVMANTPGSVYDDAVVGFGARHQVGKENGNGLVAWACSAITRQPKQPLFTQSVGEGAHRIAGSRIGLLLGDAPPVLCAPFDMHSFRREEENHAGNVPPLLRIGPKNLGKALDNLYFHGISRLKEEFIHTLLAHQNINVDNRTHQTIDPLDANQQTKARKAYTKLVRLLNKESDGGINGINEVDVNAELKHIRALLVASSLSPELLKGDTWEQRFQSALGAMSRIQGFPGIRRSHLSTLDEFLTNLQTATEQHEFLTKEMEQYRNGKHTLPDAAPTIVIFQPGVSVSPNAPNAAERLLHFPPTKEHLKLLADYKQKVQEKIEEEIKREDRFYGRSGDSSPQR